MMNSRNISRATSTNTGKKNRTIIQNEKNILMRDTHTKYFGLTRMQQTDNAALRSDNIKHFYK